MKFSAIRLLLSLTGSLLFLLGLFWLVSKEAVMAYSPPNAGEAIPAAFVHEWDVNEIFSCGDGSAQFIELRNPTSDDDETEFMGQILMATNLMGTQAHTYTFPTDVDFPIGNRTLLIATSGFSSLPGAINPDLTLPDNFLFPEGGTVRFATFDTISYGARQLPLDGVNSLNRQGTGLVTGLNSPRPFVGPPGSVSCPLTISKKGPATVNPGKLITYTLTVTSSGTFSHTNVVLTDTVPLSTTFASASGGIGPINGLLTWALGAMSSNGPSVISRTFVVTANAPIGTIIVNTNYGVRSDQTSAVGIEVQVSVTSGNIYLPLILKDFTLN